MGIVMAFNDDQRRDLRYIATIGSYIANFGGLGSEQVVKPSDLIPDAFGGGRVPSQEWLDKQYERHYARLEREQARKSNGDTGRT